MLDGSLFVGIAEAVTNQGDIKPHSLCKFGCGRRHGAQIVAISTKEGALCAEVCLGVLNDTEVPCCLPNSSSNVPSVGDRKRIVRPMREGCAHRPCHLPGGYAPHEECCSIKAEPSAGLEPATSGPAPQSIVSTALYPF